MNDILEDYLQKHAPDIPDYLIDLEDFTFRNVLKPNMISGRIQGRFLSLISKLKSPKRILELGTYTGYSALCLAEGLTPEGKLISVDVNDELESIHQKFIPRSKYTSQIEVRYQEALEFLAEPQEDPFDIIFLDAHKKSYPKYFDLCLPLLRENGLLISDNVLFYEKVLKENPSDEDTKALQKFNEKVRLSEELESFIIPLRDGISIAQKKEIQ